jgi:prophage regulatory protein
MDERLIRLPEIMRLTGFSKATVYKWIKLGKFPKPVKLSARLVAWKSVDIQNFISSCS